MFAITEEACDRFGASGVPAQAPVLGFALQGIARLKPGLTLAQANADVARRLPIWQRSWQTVPGGQIVQNNLYLDAWRLAPAVQL